MTTGAFASTTTERAPRSTIAVGRKTCLFFGSGDHASAAANVFSLERGDFPDLEKLELGPSISTQAWRGLSFPTLAELELTECTFDATRLAKLPCTQPTSSTRLPGVSSSK